MYLGMFHPSVAGPPSRPVDLSRYEGAKLRILHRFQAWWGPDRLLGRDWLARGGQARSGADGDVGALARQAATASPSFDQPRGIARQIADGTHDVYVKRWARDARNYGKPLVIRFMHEMNGDWYPWSTTSYGNSPADYSAAWRHVHDLFRAAGATNVRWVFSIDALAAGTPTSRRTLDHFYPGDQYVDWVGLSGFNWSQDDSGGKLAYDRVFRPAYEIVKGYGKPIMLTEMGSAAASPETTRRWVRDAMYSTPTRFPRVKALVFYDARAPASATSGWVRRRCASCARERAAARRRCDCAIRSALSRGRGRRGAPTRPCARGRRVR